LKEKKPAEVKANGKEIIIGRRTKNDKSGINKNYNLILPLRCKKD
jgi:hypothetical protein